MVFMCIIILFIMMQNTDWSASIIEIDANNDRSVPAPSLGTRIYNNIFYTKYQIPNVRIESWCLNDFESDYNVFYCETGTPVFVISGALKTFAEWQALGYDIHSVVVNPDFVNTTSFVPVSRLDHGTNLGAGMANGSFNKCNMEFSLSGNHSSKWNMAGGSKGIRSR